MYIPSREILAKTTEKPLDPLIGGGGEKIRGAAIIFSQGFNASNKALVKR